MMGYKIIPPVPGAQPAAGGGGVVKVQDTGIQTGSNVADDSASLGTVTAGNLIVDFISGWASAPYTTNDVTDSLTNNHVIAREQQHQDLSGNACAGIWYAENIAGGACTVTIDPTQASGNFLAWVSAEFSGAKTSSALIDEGSATVKNTTTDASCVTDGTAAAIGDLVCGSAVAAQNDDTDVGWGAAASTGYTNIEQYPDYQNIVSISADYKIATASGQQSAAWSHDDCSGTDSDGWMCVIAVFQKA